MNAFHRKSEISFNIDRIEYKKIIKWLSVDLERKLNGWKLNCRKDEFAEILKV